MQLSITKPKPKLLCDGLKEELTPKLLEAFFETKGLYCKVDQGDSHYLYNNVYGCYGFKVITRWGVGTRYEVYQEARKDLIRKIEAVAKDQNWKISCDANTYFQERFEPKETGVKVWIYGDGKES